MFCLEHRRVDIMSEDESSGGEDLLFSEQSENDDTEDDEDDVVNDRDEWRQTFMSNDIPSFNGSTPGP